MDKHFNLIDEPWIPVAGKGRVNLRQVFSESDLRALGGNPVEKIALMKLLLAIAQAAATPEDDAAWRAMGADGMARKCLAYLDQWHERFDLYGERPFLQMPAVKGVIERKTEGRVGKTKGKAKADEVREIGQPKPLGAAFYPDLPSGNNTELSQTMFARACSDAEKAVFLLSLMNFAFGGKRVEADIVSLGGEKLGSHYSAPAGPSQGGWVGQLHCYPMVDSILGTTWLNILTDENIAAMNVWPNGVGRPIWEAYPTSERDDVAKAYRSTYQSCLVAMSRFVLLQEGGIYYLDGINYPKVKDGWSEPSLIIDSTSTERKVRYVDPQKRPWRELESLLASNLVADANGADCPSLRIGIERVIDTHNTFAIWCGGLRVSSNSGDQSVKQDDDFVSSNLWLKSDWVSGRDGGIWFSQLQVEMTELNELAKRLWGGVKAYFACQQADNKKLPERSTQFFWQICERDFQSLLYTCEPDEVDRSVNAAARHDLRCHFAGYAQQAYDHYCPKDTARQLDAWARCRPNHSKYLQPEA